MWSSHPAGRLVSILAEVFSLALDKSNYASLGSWSNLFSSCREEESSNKLDRGWQEGDTLTSTLTRTHCLIEGPNRKTLPHHLWGFLWPNEKRHSCAKWLWTIWRVLWGTLHSEESQFCNLLAECNWGCWTWSQLQHLDFGLFILFSILIVASCFPRFCFRVRVHTGHRNLNEVLNQKSYDFKESQQGGKGVSDLSK